MTDRTLLYTNAFLRAFATGLIGVALGIYLSLLKLYVCQDVGHAMGSLVAGVPAIVESGGWGPLGTQRAGYQAALAGYALLAFISAGLYRRLSAAVEPHPPLGRRRVSPATRRVLWRMSSLFAIDSLGGGFLTTTLLTYYFFERFSAPPAVIAVLFFVSRVANAASHLGAAWLARRIGLVNTMVFTHIPSSLLLVSVAFAPNFPVAAVLFVLRESLVEMDVPTRQSYVMALVRPEERTLASGVTNLVRMAGWAVAPAVAGLFMQSTTLSAPLFIGAGLKIAYDVTLYRAFSRVKPPEEL